jgi:DNA-binding MarR family transcriptional regulator
MLSNGNLKHFKPVDLINIFNQSKKTGKLEISPSYSLFFLDGEITHAETESLSGELAVYEIFSLDSGDFIFYDTVDLPIKTIHKDLNQLLKEGSLKNQLTQLLKNSSISENPNSFLHLNKYELEGLDSNLIMIVEIIKNSKSITLFELAKISGIDISQYSELIQILIDKNIITVIKSDSELLWEAFKLSINTFSEEFKSISGLKLSNELDKKIQDLIILNSWNLSFKGGRIDSNELFNYSEKEQLDLYKVFLFELVNYFNKIYGNSFVEQVFDSIMQANPKIKDLKKQIII